jgi:hypothetical protein
MRKLREAALVAAMVGTLGMVGAGVATATGDDGNGTGTDGGTRLCVQNAEQSDPVYQIGLINLNQVPILGSVANPDVIQQSCVNGDNSGTWSGTNTESNGNGLLNGLGGF